MSKRPFKSDVTPVSFAARLTNSKTFIKLFCDSMALVEQTAIYLDGPGRQESKKLERKSGLAYSTESVRLTTRLMQLASWLLLYRAVKEGEISLADASRERAKIKLATNDRHDPKNLELLPVTLRALIAYSQVLQNKACRIDASIHHRFDNRRPLPPNPVEQQLGLLKAAFSPESI
jgi:regulator of CtrA degradation